MDIIKSMVLSASFLTSTLSSNTVYIAPKQEPVVLELSVQDKIVKYASDYGVSVETMLRIADAESNFKGGPNYLYKGEDSKYTAYGIFQITRTTWKTYCGENNSLEVRSDEDKNIECAMKIAKNSGYHHWNESKSNWN